MKTNEDYMRLAEKILDKLLLQIDFLIVNGKKIKKLTDGAVDTSKISDFRTGVYMVYLADLNTGILENVSLSVVDMFLDKGFFVEAALDREVYLLHVKNDLATKN